jgi:hypothetical protein
MEAVKHFPNRFYNTAIPKDIGGFDGPVVLTINPAKLTDTGFNKLEEIPPNLMYVRVRTNTWNLNEVVIPAVEYYTTREVPVVLTFMAYFNESVPDDHQPRYIFRKRTINSYWAIRTDSWRWVMKHFEENPWVHSCGKIEGELGCTKCRFCGNCHREYFVALERMRKTQLESVGLSQDELNAINQALQDGSMHDGEKPLRERISKMQRPKESEDVE